MPPSSSSSVAGPSGLSTTISTSSADGVAGPSQVSTICTSLSSDGTVIVTLPTFF